MKEFMFYIRNDKDAKKTLTLEQHLAFISASIEVRPIKTKENETGFVYPTKK
jgi:hypothetical protein